MMELRPWDAPRTTEPLEGPAMDQALAELCEHHHSFILATPYLNFDSRFLERKGDRLKVRAAFSHETVKHALATQQLRMRFPWALGYYAGATKVLGYEQDENLRSLILSVPEVLVPDEPRRALRIERVGRSTGALGSADLSLVRVNLDDISTLGAGLFATEPIPAAGFQVGRTVDVSLSLENGPRIKATGRIRHQEEQVLGLSFAPPLEGTVLQQLITWLKPRHDEAWQQWENRALFRAQAEQASKPKAPPSGILVVTKDPRMADNIALLVGDELPVRTVLPALAPFKEAMDRPPLLLICHLAEGGVEERYRVRSILESAGTQFPRLILGNGQDSDLGRQLAAEVRAGLHWDWDPNQVVFFRRLVKGLIRKHWGELAPDGSGAKPAK